MAIDMARILAELTHDSLRHTIDRLAADLPAEQRNSVMLNAIWDALVGEELEPGARGWGDYLAFKRAVVQLVGEMAGMRFVEADS